MESVSGSGSRVQGMVLVHGNCMFNVIKHDGAYLQTAPIQDDPAPGNETVVSIPSISSMGIGIEQKTLDECFGGER